MTSPHSSFLIEQPGEFRRDPFVREAHEEQGEAGLAMQGRLGRF